MNPQESPLTHADGHREAQGMISSTTSLGKPRSRLRRWGVVGLLMLPFLGLIFVLMAPWLVPGPPVIEVSVTPPDPRDVGEQRVGPVLYTLDARAPEHWTYFDFSRGSVVEVPHQFVVDWDLAFQRHKMLVNGGATNPKGKAAILNLGEVPFEAITEAPVEGYIEDTIATITADRLVTENVAIKPWYHYNWLTHLLRPKPHVYIIRTADGKYAKLRLVSYYCAGGQASGCFTFEYVYQGNGSRSFAPTLPR